MKTVILAIVCTILVVTSAEDRKCRSAEDCGEGECCLRFAWFRRNICAPLAKENESCSTDRNLFGGRYHFHCPCGNGLVCEPEEVIESDNRKDFINVRCVAEPTTGEP